MTSKQEQSRRLMRDPNHIVNVLKSADEELLLVAQGVLDQLKSSLYIFEDLQEMISTVRQVGEHGGTWDMVNPYAAFEYVQYIPGEKESAGRWDAFCIYSEVLPMSLKVQALTDGRLLLVGLAEVADRGGIGKKHFEWHDCEANLWDTGSSWVCEMCGYTAFNLREAAARDGGQVCVPPSVSFPMK